MRISDWSSDVCSSDLALRLGKHRRMTGTPHLLIVWHSRTGGSKALAEAAAEGAATAAQLVAADEVTPELLRAAGGYLFVGPENLAALSGAMKDRKSTRLNSSH